MNLYKKLFSFLLIGVSIIVGGFLGAHSASAFSGDGSGISGDPFIITSCVQLQEINDNLSASYKLNSDIDCSATSTWNSGAGFLPIENTDYPPGPFTGNFDGNGRKITGLFINRPGTLYTSLFGKIASGSEVKNVGLENVNITGGSSTSGGLAGMNIGIISNSYSTGSVSGGGYVGGLAGMNGGTISNSYSMVNVLSGSYGGGLVGANNAGTISNSYSTGSVSVSSDHGGLAGQNFNGGTITNSFWDTETSGQATSAGDAGVTGELTTDMKTGSTFTSATWDFTAIWDIKSFANNGYPFLRATTGAVTTTGGTVVHDFWNSSNTGLNITVPIANDTNLTGGTIQVQRADSGGSFFNLGAGDPYTIISGDLNTSKTLSFTASDLETGESFGEGDNIAFTVIITDSLGVVTYAQSTDTLTVDQIAPTVTNVTSTLADGTYTTGQVVPIDVTFSEPVIVTTTPQLNLATGNPETTLVDYYSGSETNTLTFNYTVVAGNTSDDLDYDATNAIYFVVSGSTIKDAEGNDANAALAEPGEAGSLGDNKNIVIDTEAPATPMASGGGPLVSWSGENATPAVVAIVTPSPASTTSTPSTLVGQVLGASTGPTTVVIAGCNNRTTGFSTTTGQSCIGNPTTVASTEKILGSGACSANLIITDNMKKGDLNDKYSDYNKGTVKQVAILQAHINRILAASYDQAAGPTDGIFGPLTKLGVERLQGALNDVLKPNPTLAIDGIVGLFTKAAINNSCGM